MTMLSQRAEAEAVEPEAQIPDPTPAEARGRAESVPTALPGIQLRNADGDSASRADEARERLAVAFARVTARLAMTAAVATRPPSVKEMHASHREAAAQWEAGLIRWPRHAYGAAHTIAKAVTDWLFAITFSPAGLILAVAFLATLWFWL